MHSLIIIDRSLRNIASNPSLAGASTSATTLRKKCSEADDEINNPNSDIDKGAMHELLEQIQDYVVDVDENGTSLGAPQLANVFDDFTAQIQAILDA